MSKKKNSRPQGDPGFKAGAVAAAIVMLGWGALKIDWSFLDMSGQATGSEVVPTAAENLPAVAAPLLEPPPDPYAAQTAWEKDPRWSEGVHRGDAGLALLKETRKWHEEVGGDPFRYAHQIRTSAEMLGEAVTDLESLLKDFNGNSSAVAAIRKELAPYSKALGPLRKEF